MQSNIINLNTELTLRQDHRALTPKQEMTIELRNYYIKKARLKRALRYHKVAHDQRMTEYIDVTECIELHEEKLLGNT